MSKTVALRKALNERLKAACPHVYYGQADKNTARPYVVYTVETVAAEDNMETMELEANVMDYGSDTEPCETIADEVERLFDKWYYLDEEIQFSAYLDRRQPVQEEDRKIIRRRILIEIHLTERRT